MPCKPRTKTELIKLSPEVMLKKHIENLNLLDCIWIEVYEQMNFFSDNKKIKMCSWSKRDFELWYY